MTATAKNLLEERFREQGSQAVVVRKIPDYTSLIQNKIDEIDTKLAILNRSSVDTGYLTSDISKIDEKIGISVSA